MKRSDKQFRTIIRASLLMLLPVAMWAQEVTFDGATSTPGEGDGAVLVAITADQALSVNIATGGSAILNTDYTLSTSTMIFGGATTLNLTVTLIDDALHESGSPKETIVLILNTPSVGSVTPITTHTLTITDNDAAPTIQFTSTSSTGSEGAGTASIEVSINTPSGLVTSVDYQDAGTGTASSGGTDYSISPGTANIPAGQLTTNITFSVNNETKYEPTQTVNLTIDTPVNAQVAIPQATHQYGITNDDSPPDIDFDDPDVDGAEGTSPITIQIRLSALSEIDASVTYTVSGTATAADHDLTTSTATITAGSQTVDLSVNLTADVIDEADETIIVTLSDENGSDLVGNTTHTFTIQDDDATPTIGFTAGGSNGAENVSSADLEVSLSAASGRNITIDYAVSGGDATGGSTDYLLASGTASILAGATTVDITMLVSSDIIYETNETVIVTLSGATNSTLDVGADDHTYTINDDDSAPNIGFSSLSSGNLENITSPTSIIVSISTVSAIDALINYSVTGGTADEGTGLDLVLGAGTATVSANALTTTINPLINDDAIFEANETFIITLSGAVDAILAGNTTHTYTITENDSPPEIGFSSTASGFSESTDPTIQISLSAAAEQTVTVDYSIADLTAEGGGVDYTLAAGTATIAIGLTSTNITTTVINDDALYESNETFRISLSNPDNATIDLAANQHTYTITDNDTKPTIKFATASGTGPEAPGTVQPTIQLSAASGLPVSVDYTISGTATSITDFTTLAAGTATIVPGETDSLLTITIVDDAIYELDETVIITLDDSPTNADRAGSDFVYTYSITNDEGLPNIDFTAATSGNAESTTAPTFGITLSSVSDVDAVVDFAVTGGTATATDDFVLAAGSATVTAGATTTTIPVTIVDDLFDEPDETIIVTLTLPVGPDAALGANTTHTYTISDDDAAPTVAFTALSSSGSEGTTPGVVNVALSAASQIAITVDYAVSGGTATGSGTDYTLISGTASFGAGVTTDVINITIIDDQLDELDETIIIDLSSPSNTTLGTIAAHTFSITDDDDSPIPFIVGAVVATGGTETIDYWNASNTALDVTVPIDNSAVLDGGTVQLLAQTAGGTAENLGAAAGIIGGELGGTKSITISAADFEGVTGFADDSTLSISAIITDANTNDTTGTASLTTIFIDQAAPAAFTVGAVVTTGGTVVADYWNMTNTNVSIVVPIASDATLAGGTIQLQGESDGTFEDIEGGTTISSADVTAGTVTITVADSITATTGVEEVAGFSEGDVLTFRAIINDAAGNPSTGTASTSEFTVDEVAPTVALTYSDTLGSVTDVITVTSTFSEDATSTPTVAIAYTSNAIAATAMTSTSATVWTYDATLPIGNDGAATMTVAGTDIAGNAVTTANTTNRAQLIVDNTAPGYILSYTDSLTRATDVVDVTAVFAELVQATPAISVNYAGSGDDLTSEAMTLGASDSIWTYQMTTPTGNDGFATVTIVALDEAGNTVVPTSGSTNTLKIDNMAPTLTLTIPADSAYVNSSALDFSLGETLDSGTVVWTWLANAGVTDGASPHNLVLSTTEAAAGIHTGLLTSLPGLVQAAEYSVMLIGEDAAGNADTATIGLATYDTLAPVITAAALLDGADASDLDSTAVRVQFSGSYSGFVEAVSGIVLYEYALGTAIGDSDLVDWTSVDTATSFTAAGLSLTYKDWYYATIRATDGAGNRTAVVNSDGMRIIDKPRVTVAVVQNRAVTEYLNVLVIDTLEMATSMALTVDGVVTALTEIDSFTYLGSHKITTAATVTYVATGTNATGDSSTTSSLAVALAKADQAWSAVSLDANFRVSSGPGATTRNQLFTVMDANALAKSTTAHRTLYRMGDGQLAFDRPVEVRIGATASTRNEPEAIYRLAASGLWEELPSMDSDDQIVAWTTRGGDFRLGKRNLIVPQQTSLRANYPNPFNPSTNISFDLGLLDGPEQRITVVVYNLLGQKVKTLMSGNLAAGQYNVIWNGADERGRSLSSGIYFVRLQTASGLHFTHKMALVK